MERNSGLAPGTSETEATASPHAIGTRRNVQRQGKARRHASWLAQGGILAEALPYMQAYTSQQIVIKFGGNARRGTEESSRFASEVALVRQLGIHPIVVHGGGPHISAMLKRLGTETHFVEGLRYTDSETADIAEMVLSGSVNKALVTELQAAGSPAVGLSGKDGNLITARRKTAKRATPDGQEEEISWGQVGEPEAVCGGVLHALTRAGFIPVVAPIAMDHAGVTLNLNADSAAGAVAAGVKAKRLLLLTDVAGVLNEQGERLATLTASEANGLIQQGIARDGMIPKLQTCIEAVRSGVEAAVILDGTAPHALLIELFTDGGSGTLILPDST